MLLICFLISLNFQKIAAVGNLKSLPVTDLTFVAYEKRKPMFAEYGKRVPQSGKYGKRTFSGVGSKWIDKYNALMQ